MHDFVNTIWSQNRDEWQPGANLSHLELTEEQQGELAREIVRVLEQSWYEVADYEKTAWGAGLMLFGAKVFQRLADGPFQWPRIGEHLGLESLSEKIGHVEYDYLERGSERHWEIQILEDENGHRRFLGTMLRHSGGGWAVVQSLAEHVRKRWSWQRLRDASQREVVDWLEGLAADYRYLEASTRQVLRSGDGMAGMAARLADLADGRERISERGWFEETAEDTAARIESAGESVTSLLNAPHSLSATEALRDVFHFRGGREIERQTEPSWQWVESGAYRPRMVLELPETIRSSAIPETADRLRIVSPGIRQEAYPIYTRDGRDEFNHHRGPRALSGGDELEFPISLMLQYRLKEASVFEVSWREKEFPGDTLAVFDRATGQLASAPESGDELVLVAPSGSLLESTTSVEDITARGVDAWRVELPEDGLEYQLLRADSNAEVVSDRIVPTADDLNVRVVGDCIEDLYFGNAPAYRGWPSFLVGEYFQKGRFELVSGDRHFEGDCSVRGGRLQLEGLEHSPGRYVLRVQVDGRRAEVHFAVLPVRSRFKDTHDQGGTTLEIDGVPGELQHHDAEEVGPSRLEFDGDICETLDVDLDARNLDPTLANGRWRVAVVPCDAEIRTSMEGEIANEVRDIGVLKGEGGVHIYGPPRDHISVEVGPHRWGLKLRPDGTRFFPFSRIPQSVFEAESQPVEVEVDWGGDTVKSLGRFLDQRLVAPEVSVHSLGRNEGYRLEMQLLWDVGGELELQVLPSWRPWAQPTRVAAERIGTNGDGVTLRADVNERPGVYKVLLTKDDKQVSGAATVELPAPAGHRLNSPERLNEFERLLWHTTARGRRFRSDKAIEKFRALDRTTRNRIRVQLVRRVSEWGARWFDWREMVPEIASEENLRTTVRLDVPHIDNRRARRVFEDVSSFAIRYHDLREIEGEMRGASGDERADIFLRLAEEHIGLVVPAFDAWKGYLCDSQGSLERIAPEIQPWNAERQSDDVRRLSADEREALIVVDEPVPDEAQPRLIALRQARSFEGELYEASQFGRLVGDYLQEAMTRLPDRLNDLILNGQVPERTAQIEMAVAWLCRRIHRWRTQVHSEPLPWEDIGIIAGYVPRLFDFWLNRFYIDSDNDLEAL